MTRIVLLAAILGADAPASAPPKPDLEAYRAAAKEAGRDASAHVRLALWCEARGLTAERLEHLAVAVAIDPTNLAARGLMGLVPDGGRWSKPDDVAERARADAKLAEYAALRSKSPITADAQWKLALWCEDHGLEGESKAHLAAVIRLDPSREVAWKRLGYKKMGGRWRTDAQLVAEKAEREAQAAADRSWKARIEAIRDGLRVPARRAESEAALAAIADPRAVPALVRSFGQDARHHAKLAQTLGQIDSPPSSRALAQLAVFSDSPDARRAAAETLRGRDPREFAEGLIVLLRDPMRYEVRPIDGPGSTGVLMVEGERFNVRRIYRTPAEPVWNPRSGDTLGVDEFGLPAFYSYSTQFVGTTDRFTADKVVDEARRMEQGVARDQAAAIRGMTENLPAASRPLARKALGLVASASSIVPNLQDAIGGVAAAENLPTSEFGFVLGRTTTFETKIPIGQMQLEARKAALAGDAQMREDVAAIEAANAETLAFNARVGAILSDAAGVSLPPEREAWKLWYVDQLGYSSRTTREAPRPTFDQDVPPGYVPRPIPVATQITNSSLGFQRMSCFAAGTLVRTVTGPRPIEDLRMGDRVLSQDAATGSLAYRPIVGVHHNPPSPTVRVKVGDEAIVASTFHRFWVAGRGWRMARDLRPGDPIRTLDGVVEVASVEEDKVQPVFNLDVAEARTFFAGESAALVHDNSVPDFRAAPFDAADLAKVSDGPR